MSSPTNSSWTVIGHVGWFWQNHSQLYDRMLSYALREAVERMDFNLIHELAEKAIATRERIATEQLAESRK